MDQAHTASLLQKVKGDYSRIAKAFSATRRNAWEEFDHFAAYLKPNQRILDLGCGNGRLAAFLKGRGVSYLGIDNNPDMLGLAQVMHPGEQFLLGDQMAIPLKNESVDHIWNIAAFHHIPTIELRRSALTQMHRVLKSEGFLMMTVWNLWQKRYRKYVYRSMLQNLFDRAYELKSTFIPWKNGEEVARYYHAFSQREVRVLLKQSRFEVVDYFATRRGKKVPALNSHNFCFIARKM